VFGIPMLKKVKVLSPSDVAVQQVTRAVARARGYCAFAACPTAVMLGLFERCRIRCIGGRGQQGGEFVDIRLAVRVDAQATSDRPD